MTNSYSRRDFLKMGGLAFAGLALGPGPIFPRPLDISYGTIGRVTINEID